MPETDFAGLPAGTRAVALPDNSFNATTYFLTVFGRPESSSACECERTQEASLAQSLHLLNSPQIQTKLSDPSGRAAMVAKDPRSEDDKIADIYRVAFTRAPRAAEIDRARAHIARVTANKNGPEALAARQQAYEDILWALINTKEFLFNH